MTQTEPFDKKTYRERRELGLRGQGDKIKPKFGRDPNLGSTQKTTKPLSRYAMRKHTKRARKAELEKSS